MLYLCVFVGKVPDEGQPQLDFEESLNVDLTLAYSGVLRMIPSPRNLGAAEWVARLQCWRREFYLGVFEYYPGSHGNPPCVYFRPHPGRVVPLSHLRRVMRDSPEETTQELRAMAAFSEYNEGELGFHILGFAGVFHLVGGFRRGHSAGGV